MSQARGQRDTLLDWAAGRISAARWLARDLAEDGQLWLRRRGRERQIERMRKAQARTRLLASAPKDGI